MMILLLLLLLWRSEVICSFLPPSPSPSDLHSYNCVCVFVKHQGIPALPIPSSRFPGPDPTFSTAPPAFSFFFFFFFFFPPANRPTRQDERAAGEELRIADISENHRIAHVFVCLSSCDVMSCLVWFVRGL